MNVLDIEMLRRLNGALRQCDVPEIRVLVLSSALPRAFSAGVDIADHVASRSDAMLAEVRENARLLLNLRPITIAAIQGSTLGGGAEIALLCDIVIAADDTVLAFPEITLAAFPPVAAACLPERCTGPLAMGLLLGESMDARAAQQAGLVRQGVATASLAQTAEEMAKKLDGRPQCCSGWTPPSPPTRLRSPHPAMPMRGSARSGRNGRRPGVTTDGQAPDPPRRGRGARA